MDRPPPGPSLRYSHFSDLDLSRHTDTAAARGGGQTTDESGAPRAVCGCAVCTATTAFVNYNDAPFTHTRHARPSVRRVPGVTIRSSVRSMSGPTQPPRTALGRRRGAARALERVLLLRRTVASVRPTTTRGTHTRHAVNGTMCTRVHATRPRRWASSLYLDPQRVPWCAPQSGGRAWAASQRLDGKGFTPTASRRRIRSQSCICASLPVPLQLHPCCFAAAACNCFLRLLKSSDASTAHVCSLASCAAQSESFCMRQD